MNPAPPGPSDGLYRPSTLADMRYFTRLQDTLDNVAWFMHCCIATDAPDPFDLDVTTAYALLKNTTKSVATALTLAENVVPIVQMFDIAAGGVGQFSKRPFVTIHISPVISPMRFGEDAVDVVYKCIEHNIPMSCITAAQTGATAPVTLAGFLGASFEAFILDDDMRAMTDRTLRGIEVSEENLGYDAICDAILGDGHFLDSGQTHAAMERDYHYPKLADHEQARTWEEARAEVAWSRPNTRVREILAEHKPNYLSTEQDAQIESIFNVLG